MKLNNSNIDSSTVEQYYQQYLENPDSLDPSWQGFFAGVKFAQNNVSTNLQATHQGSNGITDKIRKETNIHSLIMAYRSRGHLFANISPVRNRSDHSPKITLKRFHLNEEDLDIQFNAGTEIGIGVSTLREIIRHLEQTYCGTIGSEFSFIRHPDIIRWVSKRIEKNRNQPNFSKEKKLKILDTLNRAVIFEKYMHTKFVGQKRFSLEGSEAIIPALNSIVEIGASLGIEEFVLGMAHRGRLNILANVMGKGFDIIFSEFAGKSYSNEEHHFGGDVKYHMGFSSDKYTTLGKRIHLSMPPNPSHLEAINPVVEGIVGAKSKDRYGENYSKIAPILIHGDASISGQGIIYEVSQMSELDGYKAGGTIHVILNNQIGFTTSYKDARSSTYCTDIAKVTKSPAFHVNGDDIESVVHTISLAIEFRQKFQRDVYIDIICYRKHGHNEGDDPHFTQPNLYKKIKNHPNSKEIYAKKLLEENVVTQKYLEEIEQNFRNLLDKNLESAKKMEHGQLNSFFAGDWRGIKLPEKREIYNSQVTGFEENKLDRIAEKITVLPKDCKFFYKAVKIYKNRYKLFFDDKKIDWALGEQLAWATLLVEGYNVRVSGQDVQRGTFSHRHSVLLVEEEDDEKYIPLAVIRRNQGNFSIINSLLSEYGVLGFEFGYSMASPNTLTIWEAQFGDFCNGAQIIIDQFISASESKWQRMNGLVMQLPHGYEGQGPEHSSAKIERFLSMCAEENMIVVNCTTPANFFHFLRRQMLRNFRKPAIIFTPKSLLRHPECKSSISEIISETRFQEIIDDVLINTNITRVLFCSGKIYYDLLKYRRDNKIENTAIIRLEQLYPLKTDSLIKIKNKYSMANKFFWVQEEPKNMGAWSYVISNFPKKLNIEFIGREKTSATATGFIQQHLIDQQKLVEKSFS